MEERSVLEYAEIIIDRQRDKINELERENAEQKENNDYLQKEILKNEEENKILRLELNRKNDSDMMIEMHLNKENEFLEKIHFLENQLLKRDSLLEELHNLIKKRKFEHDRLIHENNNLKSVIDSLRTELCEERKQKKENEHGIVSNEKEKEELQNLYKNNKEELNITKRCLIQIEGELHLFKKQNEKQKNEIQRLYKLIDCMNKEKALVPPIILTTQVDSIIREKGEYAKVKSEREPIPNAIIKEDKTTKLVDPTEFRGNFEYDENLLKLNFIQNQEEHKSAYNKILEILRSLQIKTNEDNSFFFSCQVLHYCKKPSMLNYKPGKDDEDYSDSNTYELVNESDHITTPLSGNSSTLDKNTEIKTRQIKKGKGRGMRNQQRITHRKKKNRYNQGFNKKASFLSTPTLAQLNKQRGKGINGRRKDRDLFSNSSISNSQMANSRTESMSTDNHNDSRCNSSSSDSDSSSSDYSKSFNSRKSSLEVPSYTKYGANSNDSEHNRRKYEERERKFLNKLSHYKKRFVGITSQHIYIYNAINEEEPLYIIRLQNLRSIKAMFNHKLYIIEHTPYNNFSEKHFIYIQDDDKSLRMFHALQYAGFLKPVGPTEKENLHISSSSTGTSRKKIDHGTSSKRESLQKGSVGSKLSSPGIIIKVDIFTPSGKDKDGQNIPYLAHNVLVKADLSKNQLKIRNINDGLYILQCEECLLMHYQNKFTVSFINGCTEHNIIPKNNDSVDSLYNILTQLTWGKYPENSHSTPRAQDVSCLSDRSKREVSVIEDTKHTDREETEPKDELVGDIFIIKDNILYIMKDGSPITEDSIVIEDDNIMEVLNTDSLIIKNDEQNELTIINKPSSSNQETYIYNLPAKEKYDYWVQKLKDHNFNVMDKKEYDKRKAEDEEQRDLQNIKPERRKKRMFVKNNEVVVIERGVLLIYKNYGNEDSEPILKFEPETCKVVANETNGEISLKNTKEGSKEKIVLDCLNKLEFIRWKNALRFGGFLPGKMMSNKYVNLKKHIFPINLFDSFDPKDSLVKVEGSFLKVYASHTSSRPLFSFEKKKIELMIIPELRKFRIYLQRDTQYEQRFDLTITLARDFNYIKEQVEKAQFYSLSHKKTQRIKKPFVLCKKNIVVIHRDKYSLKPEVVFEKKNVTVSLDKPNLTITFHVNGNNPEENGIKKLVLENEVNFNKWIVTLKLATLIETTQNIYEHFTFPGVCFGHTCPEAIQLLKKKNFFTELFKKKKDKNSNDKSKAGSDSRTLPTIEQSTSKSVSMRGSIDSVSSDAKSQIDESTKK